MYQKVETGMDFCGRELQVLDFWKQNDIVKKSLAPQPNKPPFSFFDGPPTANGMPHIGHLITRSFKDLVPRYKRCLLYTSFIMLVLPLAEAGSFLAPIFYFILLGGVTYAENLFFVRTGYKMGTDAALSILQGGMIQKFISCASVLGMFMMGGLSSSMVSVTTPIQIPTGDTTAMSVQKDILDAIAPGLLTLAAVLLVYKYLRSGKSIMKATFWLLGIGLVLGAIGIIGEGGLLLKPIAVAAA